MTKYALELLQLFFRISSLSQVTDATFSSFIPERHAALNSEEAGLPLSSMGKHRVGCSTAGILDSHWLKRSLCPAHRTPSVSGSLWSSGRASADPDARLLHDDWMICLRLNAFLTDREMSESAIFKCTSTSSAAVWLHSVSPS